MKDFSYIVLRRLRWPLIVLIIVYAVSIIGFVSIPGVDDKGQPYQMGLFRAFYFVSFMGATIGFGEIPYAFTTEQRMWTTVTLYATVVAWLYCIGKVLAYFQDASFKRIVSRITFQREVAKIKEPFYLICGYGVTGRLVVKSLANSGIRSVVVESNPDALDRIAFDRRTLEIPYFCSSVDDPRTLTMAGIDHECCIGVLALTGCDKANLAAAITSKLLNEKRLVISRSKNQDIIANLKSFNTDAVINPFATFAELLILAIIQPVHYKVFLSITGIHRLSHGNLKRNHKGFWVMCGFGRFGSAIYKRLVNAGIKVFVIDPDPQMRGAPFNSIKGVGTEAETLLKAHIADAEGIIAGTDSDINNLSIVYTARSINRDLTTVARRNDPSNGLLFDVAKIDMVMAPGEVVANKVISLIKTPLLEEFFNAMNEKTTSWARHLLDRIEQQERSSSAQDAFDYWEVSVNRADMPAVMDILREDSLALQTLLTHASDEKYMLPVLPLMVKRNDTLFLLPDSQFCLQEGDRLLLLGSMRDQKYLHRIFYDSSILYYRRFGIYQPRGYFFRWLQRRSENH